MSSVTNVTPVANLSPASSNLETLVGGAHLNSDSNIDAIEITTGKVDVDEHEDMRDALETTSFSKIETSNDKHEPRVIGQSASGQSIEARKARSAGDAPDGDDALDDLDFDDPMGDEMASEPLIVERADPDGQGGQQQEADSLELEDEAN